MDLRGKVGNCTALPQKPILQKLLYNEHRANCIDLEAIQHPLSINSSEISPSSVCYSSNIEEVLQAALTHEVITEDSFTQVKQC